MDGLLKPAGIAVSPEGKYVDVASFGSRSLTTRTNAAPKRFKVSR